MRRELFRGTAQQFARDERGSVTAEFAITVPAVLLVLGIVIGGIHLAAERVALVSLAGDVARLEARGDSSLAASRIASDGRSPTIRREHDGGVLCVEATSAPRPGLLAAIQVQGRGCAALSAATGEW
ncbi:MAG: TadE/TadG family type IV pilus assembly protein [Leucobacter sp.]